LNVKRDARDGDGLAVGLVKVVNEDHGFLEDLTARNPGAVPGHSAGDPDYVTRWFIELKLINAVRLSHKRLVK
jgi:hypothetical protein